MDRPCAAVNKNLTGFGGVGGGVGCLSTDQKKKLLWGSKKSSSTEEVKTHHLSESIYPVALLNSRLVCHVMALFSCLYQNAANC